MRVLGPVHYVDSAHSYNFTIPVGANFPISTAPQDGEFWILSDPNNEGEMPGLYMYNLDNTEWRLILTDAQLPGGSITGDDGTTTFTLATLQGSDTIQLTDAGGNLGVLTTKHPKIQLKTTSTIDINTASEIAIPWQTQQFYDSDLFTHSTTANNTRITVLKTGVLKVTYMINYTVQGTNKTGSIKSYIKVNGTVVTETTSYSWIDQGESPQGTNQLVTFIPVTANDQIILYCIRNGNNPVMNIRPTETTFSLVYHES